jgi:hypothetical protein
MRCTSTDTMRHSDTTQLTTFRTQTVGASHVRARRCGSNVHAAGALPNPLPKLLFACGIRPCVPAIMHIVHPPNPTPTYSSTHTCVCSVAAACCCYCYCCCYCCCCALLEAETATKTYVTRTYPHSSPHRAASAAVAAACYCYCCCCALLETESARREHVHCCCCCMLLLLLLLLLRAAGIPCLSGDRDENM